MFTNTPEWLIATAYSAATAFLVLLVGWYLSSFVSHHLRRLLETRTRFDKTIAPILAEILRYAILAITFVVVLGQFGVQTASILAVIGAIGLAIALALQGTLSNMAAGIMLIWLRPFSVGEYIDGEGIAGTVLEIGLFATKLRTYDGIFTFAPNSRLWNAKITNYTRQQNRMIELTIGVAYGASIEKVRIVILGAAKDPRVLPDPAPMVFVAELGASSVNVTLRCWVASSDWWNTKVTLLERCKTELDAAGIEIPFSKLDINILSQAPAREAD